MHINNTCMHTYIQHMHAYIQACPHICMHGMQRYKLQVDSRHTVRHTVHICILNQSYQIKIEIEQIIFTYRTLLQMASLWHAGYHAEIRRIVIRRRFIYNNVSTMFIISALGIQLQSAQENESTSFWKDPRTLCWLEQRNTTCWSHYCMKHDLGGGSFNGNLKYLQDPGEDHAMATSLTCHITHRGIACNSQGLDKLF